MRREWITDAACLGMLDDDIWFQPGRGNVPVEALRICRGCPVRAECLDDALSSNDPTRDDGVWGGTTPKLRSEIRQGRLSRAGAMARGDVMSERRTAEEIAEDPRFSRRVA